MCKATDSMRRGLEEALAYVEGTADVSRYGIHILGADPLLPVGHRPRPQGCPESAGSPP
jgi:hypothetical protein